ncbi:Oxidoreductase [Lasiodiplodia theobromae]|uniref:Oxidoreductase n=1 Tax=Lasiodiplodia theobromae TaxID=45133 RepID=UPI0015C40CCE|nr:Oxidoreductase [Lasiodiplodia theobromae]KAF4536231.1 Oxidoreductase [Lasiodiplodia theobromae]
MDRPAHRLLDGQDAFEDAEYLVILDEVPEAAIQTNARPKYDFSTTAIDSNENNNGLQSYCRHERNIMKLKFSGILNTGYGHTRQLASVRNSDRHKRQLPASTRSTAAG